MSEDQNSTCPDLDIIDKHQLKELGDSIRKKEGPVYFFIEKKEKDKK